ncbi:MAG: hypothetical protein Q4D07_03735 [Selenomonadaceae bacterium]|nr:hypothetical protein [Selenomonadaceae bacterium]
MENNRIDFEVKLGGICGAVAVVAIIIEVFLKGGNVESIVGGIKDIAGTIVGVLVLVSAWMALHPKKSENFDFEKELEQRLSLWQEEHKNMISYDESIYDLYMKTDITNFFEEGTSNKKGRFVLIQLADITTVTFSLNKGLFIGTGADDTWKEQLDNIGQMMRTYVYGIYQDFAEIKYDKSKKNIVATLKAKPNTETELNKIIEMLNTMYQAFLVCASTKK